jgi:hypothetical protein
MKDHFEIPEEDGPRAFILQFKDTGYADVDTPGESFRIRATSQSGQYTSGIRRMCRTFNWAAEDGRLFRVQVCVTDPGGEL